MHQPGLSERIWTNSHLRSKPNRGRSSLLPWLLPWQPCPLTISYSPRFDGRCNLTLRWHTLQDCLLYCTCAGVAVCIAITLLIQYSHTYLLEFHSTLWLSGGLFVSLAGVRLMLMAEQNLIFTEVLQFVAQTQQTDRIRTWTWVTSCFYNSF